MSKGSSSSCKPIRQTGSTMSRVTYAAYLIYVAETISVMWRRFKLNANIVHFSWNILVEKLYIVCGEKNLRYAYVCSCSPWGLPLYRKLSVLVLEFKRPTEKGTQGSHLQQYQVSRIWLRTCALGIHLISPTFAPFSGPFVPCPVPCNIM